MFLCVHYLSVIVLLTYFNCFSPPCTNLASWHTGCAFSSVQRRIPFACITQVSLICLFFDFDITLDRAPLFADRSPRLCLDCNTYNADYDGDEMNCHFPQSYLAMAESHFIASTDEQFIVPTDGSPLRGLIQDHVDAGVKLTQMNTFIERDEYQQLLFAALGSLPGLELIRSDADIELQPPAIRRPKELWTGKHSATPVGDALF